jgi:HD-GYP domain-containing protein (c-di-GMP phosphodiesterase class II)/Flp pilus assembly protein TadD
VSAATPNPQNLQPPMPTQALVVEIDALLGKAHAALEQEPTLAADFALMAEQLASDSHYLTGLAKALFLAGSAQHKLSHFKPAITLLVAARLHYRNLNDKSGELGALLELNRVYRANGDTALAGECLNRALALSQDTQRRDAQADVLNGLAAVSNMLADAEQALKYLLKSLEIRRAIKDLKGEIDCLNNLGILHTHSGDYADAIEVLSECHKLIQTTPQEPEVEASCLNNIGNVYQDQGHYGAALAKYQLALDIARTANLSQLESTALTNLAETHLLMGSPSEALRLYDEVFVKAQMFGYAVAEIDALEGIVRTNIHQGHFSKALDVISRALEISRNSGNLQREILLLLDLAQTRKLLAEIDSAIEAIQEAIKLASKASAKKLLHDAEVQFSMLLELTGDVAGAFNHYRIAHQLERELFNEESDRRLQGLTARFDLERARAEAETYRERTLEIERVNKTLEHKVRERTLDLEQAQIETVTRLALAAEYRDDNTGQHTYRVGNFAALLAKAIGMPELEVQALRIAARLHDVGKIGISDLILLKPGKLTPNEYELIKDHTTIGAQILSGGKSSILKLAEQIAMTHHERWDGNGYPNKLSGNDIPLVGRIVAVADVYDALTTERPYKKAWTHEESITELEAQSGKMFDPKIIEVVRTVFASISVSEHGVE